MLLDRHERQTDSIPHLLGVDYPAVGRTQKYTYADCRKDEQRREHRVDNWFEVELLKRTDVDRLAADERQKFEVVDWLIPKESWEQMVARL